MLRARKDDDSWGRDGKVAGFTRARVEQSRPRFLAMKGASDRGNRSISRESGESDLGPNETYFENESSFEGGASG